MPLSSDAAAARLSRLHDVAVALSEATSVEQVAEAVVRQVMQGTDAAGAAVVLPDGVTLAAAGNTQAPALSLPLLRQGRAEGELRLFFEGGRRELAPEAQLFADTVARCTAQALAARLQLDGILRHLPLGVIVADHERALYRNPRYDELFGRAAWDPSWKVTRADGTPVSVDQFPMKRSLCAGEIVQDEEYELTTGGVPVRTLRVSSAPLTNSAGHVETAVAVVSDVTDLKRVERELVEAHDTLEAVFQASPLAIILLDIDGTIRLWNAAAERIFGYRADEAIGRHAPMVPPDRRDEFMQNLARTAAGELLSGFETRRMRKDGTLVDVALWASGFTNPDGRRQTLGMMADISERKRTQESLRFLAEASSLLSSSLDYHTTLGNVVRLAVPRLADWCAVDMVEEVPGGELLAVAHVDPAKVEWVREMRRRWPARPEDPLGAAAIARSGKSLLMPEVPDEALVMGCQDAEHLRLTRELGLKSAIAVPLMVQGRGIGMLTLVSAESGYRYGEADLAVAEELARRAALAIENARLYHSAREAVRLRDDFLSVAGHELKTPLTALQLQLQIALRQVRQHKEPRVLEQRVQAGVTHVGRIEKLIGELLDVSRLAAGRLSLHLEDVDFVQVVREVTARFADEMQRHGCTLAIEMPPSLLGHWDPMRLEQIITNLLSNAIKYGKDQPIDLRLESVDVAGVPGARLVVRDRGIGIAPADQARIFGRFERAVSERHYGGLGLGLWIVRQIIEALGGTIRVESTPGEGAAFFVELPRTGAVDHVMPAPE